MSFADKVTILRILLIPVFISFLFYFDSNRLYLRYFIVGIFFLATLTDFFDGIVARLKKEKSKLGVVIDPLADKLLLLISFISLYAIKHLPIKYKIPFWVVSIFVSRDLIILLGVGILSFLKIEVPIAPSIWGKLTTFFQMLTILCVLLDFYFSKVIWIIAVCFTVISGVNYFLRGIRVINAKVNSSTNS